MQELKLQPRKVVKVWVGEVSYEVKKPSNRDLSEFTKDESLDKFAVTVKFLDKLGLPEAVCWELDPESVSEIVKALVPQEKKS